MLTFLLVWAALAVSFLLGWTARALLSRNGEV